MPPPLSPSCPVDPLFFRKLCPGSWSRPDLSPSHGISVGMRVRQREQVVVGDKSDFTEYIIRLHEKHLSFLVQHQSHYCHNPRKLLYFVCPQTNTQQLTFVYGCDADDKIHFRKIVYFHPVFQQLRTFSTMYGI